MKIAIVGGGAAGMMAASTLALGEKKHEISLIDKNLKLGMKVLISGGGRCNVTTGISDVKEILKKYPRGENFLKYAMYKFPPEKVCEFFIEHGAKLKTEKDNRVFPESDNGAEIIRVFEIIFAKHRVNLILNNGIKKIEKDSEKFILHFDNREDMIVDKVILTTGGQTYRSTGSTGDGYSFAEALGHRVTKLAPSLGAFILKEDFVKKLAGISFQTARLKIIGEKNQEFTGPFIFTHKGISGPAVFALSALTAYEKCPMKLSIDFLPEVSYEDLRKKLDKEILNSPKKLFINTLTMFVTRAVAKSFFELLKIDESKKSGEIAKKDINHIIEFLKNLQLNIIDRQTGEEFVTAGGVDLKEVDPKTMQSKICPGLYFAGEILDIDGFTGGFNLQAAWCTGKLAGESA